MNPSHEESGAVDIGAVVSGKYRIERELGGSGFARVFRAKNLMLGRDVAIKCVRREHLSDTQRVDDFFREARVTHQARHPHVVDVLDVGFHGATPYVVQEFLTGEDLAGYLVRKGAQVSVRAVIERMLPVIDGVAHAHARGVVHGGLRPENVFLARTPDGIIPKVLDFGVALGAFVGTPAFSSPEQLDGTHELDARSDVWSLGVMLYALLSGCIPFRSTDAASLVEEIRTSDALPLAAAAPSLSPALAEVVDRCLQRDPDARHPDAAALARCLRALPEAPVTPVGGLQIVAPSLAPPPEEPEEPAEAVETFVLHPTLEESFAEPRESAPAFADEAIDAALDSIGRPTVYDTPTDEDAHRPLAVAANPAEIELDTPLHTKGSTPPADDDTIDDEHEDDLAEDPAQRFHIPGLGGPSRRTVLAAVATVLALTAFAFVWRRVRYGAPRAATPITPVNLATGLPPVTESVSPAAPATPPPAVPEHHAPVAAATADGGATAPSAAHHGAPTSTPRATTDGGEEAPVAPSAAATHTTEEGEPAAPSNDPATPESEPASAEGEPAPPEQALPSASIDPVVEQAVNEHSEAIDRCLEQAQEPRGRVNVRLVIAQNGAVRAATPFAPPALRPVGQCIAREMRTWRIVVPDATEDSIITWPFDLSPSAD